MSTALKRHSPADYLALDRAAATRSEYYFGEVVAMAGASAAHNAIVANLVGEVRSALKGHPCRVVPSDMRTRTTTGAYCYPDVSIICGQPQYDDHRQDILLNPLVIFEVLSPSTESYDRGSKFMQYRSIPSLQAYILVAQDQAVVECFSRDPRGWLLTEARGVDQSIHIPGVDIELPLAEIYDKVEFPPPEGVG